MRDRETKKQRLVLRQGKCHVIRMFYYTTQYEMHRSLHMFIVVKTKGLRGTENVNLSIVIFYGCFTTYVVVFPG